MQRRVRLSLRHAGALAAACAVIMTGGLGGCGGGSSSTPVAPVIVPAAPTTTLSGTMNVVDLIVPAGSSATIVRDVTVNASGRIQIDGTLIVTPGTHFAFFANGPVTLDGPVVAGAVAASAASRAAAPHSGARKPLGGAGACKNVLNGASVNVGNPGGGMMALNPGDDLDVSTSSSSGAVTITGAISLPPGADATSAAPPDTRGGAQSGGSIEIGTPAANGCAGKSAVTPASLIGVGSTVIVAGNGGHGFDDDGGILKLSGELLFETSDGASGGAVNVEATSFKNFFGAIRGGGGGNGGNVTSSRMDIDGDNKGKSAVDFDATSGSGGNGGAVLTSTDLLFQARGGVGGNAGSITGRAGNGGPGQPGGSTYLTLGNPGTTGAPLFSQLPHGLPASVTLTGGGNGGEGYVAANGSVGGGTGGLVSVESALPNLSVQVTGNAILAVGPFANGGKGGNGCLTMPGTRGGDGGNLYAVGVGVVGPGSPIFSGGDGGPGMPPGAPGGIGGGSVPGKVKLGTDGKAGGPCPTPTPVPTPTSPGAGPTPTPTPSASPSPSPSPTPSASPSPTPTVSPTAPSHAALILTPQTFAFNFPGDKRTFTASESGYTGTISFAFNCPTQGSATVSPSSGTGPSVMTTVTAVSTSGGTQCTLTASDQNGQTAIATGTL